MLRAAFMTAGATLCTTLALAQTPAPAPNPPQAPARARAPASAQRIVGTMSDLMVQMIYPTSDAIFYISTRTPKTDQEWLELQGKTLTLAESANLLMMPSRARATTRISSPKPAIY